MWVLPCTLNIYLDLDLFKYIQKTKTEKSMILHPLDTHNIYTLYPKCFYFFLSVSQGYQYVDSESVHLRPEQFLTGIYHLIICLWIVGAYGTAAPHRIDQYTYTNYDYKCRCCGADEYIFVWWSILPLAYLSLILTAYRVAKTTFYYELETHYATLLPNDSF